MANKNILIFCFLFISNFTLAEGLNTAWPLEMNSSKSFDVASKCEMLVFIQVLNEFKTLSKSDLSLNLKVKKINLESINEWEGVTKERIIVNFKALSEESLSEVIAVNRKSSWGELSSLKLEEKIPSKFLTWYAETKKFYTNYVKEQLRLAALYPRITSEILRFSKNEIQGHNFSDKRFLLTFDDGPTMPDGNTDKLIKVLDNQGLKAMFFVLGENLENRLKTTSIKSLNDLYGKHKVVSHGKVHKSHQSYSLWKESIDYTNSLLYKIFPTKNKNELIYFRPPYGQRNKKLVDYFSGRKSKIILWNIDSRDWSSKLNPNQVANRQVKLMLLWRKGILLFHDIHAKSQKVVPLIQGYFSKTNIVWEEPNML